MGGVRKGRRRQTYLLFAWMKVSNKHTVKQKGEEKLRDRREEEFNVASPCYNHRSVTE